MGTIILPPPPYICNLFTYNITCFIKKIYFFRFFFTFFKKVFLILFYKPLPQAQPLQRQLSAPRKPHGPAGFSFNRQQNFPANKKEPGKNRTLIDGAGGNRTRVQETVHCPSTIIAGYLTFPPADGNRQPSAFSSFIIRPYAQSLTYVVSHIFDARILRCECPKADSCH